MAKSLRARGSYQDLVISKVNPDGDSLLFSTFVGGVGNDWATGVAVDPDGNVYVTGDTRSPDFPMVNPLQRFNSSGSFDALILQLSDVPYMCGDADLNGIVNIADAVFLVTFVFDQGRAPEPLMAGDVDCNLMVNISDVVYLISYVFGGWPDPCAECR
jgi:hypothetical protein